METSLRQFLEQRLKKEVLPGRPAQRIMAPEPINEGAAARSMDEPAHARASSVLILLYPNKQNCWEFILTLRTGSISHGGQISFPGGRTEAGETAIDAALREAHEEVGITPAKVHVAGTITPLYVAHSNSMVTPVVAFLDAKPALTLNPAEVEEAFSIEVKSLRNKQNLVTEIWQLRDDAAYRVPFWDVHEVPLWGATAMILGEFLQLYDEWAAQVGNN